MKYLPKSRSRHPYRRSLGILATVFVTGAILFYLLDSLIITVVAPAWRMENMVARKFSELSGFFHTQTFLLAENARQKERLASLEIELSSVSASREQENHLLALLGRDTESLGITAAVLTHPPQTPYDILTIDAGEKDGVTLGALVILPEGSAVGEVLEVFGGLSKIKLFTSSGMKTNAVLERNNMPVVLEGTGAGNFRVVVPRDTAVEIGDKILSADLSARLVGIVEDSTFEPTASFQEVLARSPANIFNLRFVLIKR
ncbi:MAG: rod shape-determining protein MreC [bacterium]|nr:rod shape-determining protein MreC [bacterium]